MPETATNVRELLAKGRNWRSELAVVVSSQPSLPGINPGDPLLGVVQVAQNPHVINRDQFLVQTGDDLLGDFLTPDLLPRRLGVNYVLYLHFMRVRVVNVNNPRRKVRRYENGELETIIF